MPVREISEIVMLVAWVDSCNGLGGYSHCCEADMLTPEQVAEIRERVRGVFDEKAEKDLTSLLADRAEIAQELEEIRRMITHDGYADRALTALIERIGK